MFKLLDRIGIAEHNSTMMAELDTQIEQRIGQPFDAQERGIRCLAHVINLATQALISKYSSSKYYDPHDPDSVLDDATSHLSRDELGIVRAVAVKEHSSSKRKELFRKLQMDREISQPCVSATNSEWALEVFQALLSILNHSTLIGLFLRLHRQRRRLCRRPN
ncbi:hypothetical protein K439DRAFT_191640 [Ramaria rubella]|nr:hypothetical protein K439DRAFT_191640 [Ramaria rubella]